MTSHASPPLESANSTHQGAWTVIITAIGLAILLICLCIRAYVRSATTVIAGKPDYAFALASVVAIAQSCLVFWEVSYGLGTAIRLLSETRVHRLQEASFASDVLYLFAIYLSKCCFCFVYLALTPSVRHNYATYGVLGLATAWLFSSILGVGINCELNPPWSDLASHCSNLFIRWQCITAFDIIIEILLFMLAIYLVIDLQTGLQRKLVITCVFGLRLLVIIPTAFRLHYLGRQIRSTDPTFSAALTVIWTVIEIYGGVIACISYSFKTFAAAVSTDYGGIGIHTEVYDATNNRSVRGQNSGSGGRAAGSGGNDGSGADKAS